MTDTWLLAALWVGLALAATIISFYLRIATALSEIVVGTVAQLVICLFVGSTAMGMNVPWIVFLSGAGAILLTFLAGAELDPEVFRLKWKEASLLGLVGFFAPFLVATAVAFYVLHWDPRASWLAGVALSTTSVAVVYAVMLEFGLNKTQFGKTILAACFINDLGTVAALGLIFSPFTVRTLVFGVGGTAAIAVLPWVAPRILGRYGGRPSEAEAKLLLLCLFGLGGLAAWAGSEAVLPAYIVGMVLAGSVGRNHALVRRLRTLTFGLLTPFYFIRAGAFVSIPAIIASPFVLLSLLGAKMASKFVAVYPVTRFFGNSRGEGMYTTMLMPTGLTFGSISALFGLSHHIITQAQYSYLVATVIASAVVPTLIANIYYLPRHLLKKQDSEPHAGAKPVGQSVLKPEGALD